MTCENLMPLDDLEYCRHLDDLDREERRLRNTHGESPEFELEAGVEIDEPVLDPDSDPEFGGPVDEPGIDSDDYYEDDDRSEKKRALEEEDWEWILKDAARNEAFLEGRLEEYEEEEREDLWNEFVNDLNDQLPSRRVELEKQREEERRHAELSRQREEKARKVIEEAEAKRRPEMEAQKAREKAERECWKKIAGGHGLSVEEALPVFETFIREDESFQEFSRLVMESMSSESDLPPVSKSLAHRIFKEFFKKNLHNFREAQNPPKMTSTWLSRRGDIKRHEELQREIAESLRKEIVENFNNDARLLLQELRIFCPQTANGLAGLSLEQFARACHLLKDSEHEKAVVNEFANAMARECGVERSDALAGDLLPLFHEKWELTRAEERDSFRGESGKERISANTADRINRRDRLASLEKEIGDKLKAAKGTEKTVPIEIPATVKQAEKLEGEREKAGREQRAEQEQRLEAPRGEASPKVGSMEQEIIRLRHEWFDKDMDIEAEINDLRNKTAHAETQFQELNSEYEFYFNLVNDEIKRVCEEKGVKFLTEEERLKLSRDRGPRNELDYTNPILESFIDIARKIRREEHYAWQDRVNALEKELGPFKSRLNQANAELAYAERRREIHKRKYEAKLLELGASLDPFKMLPFASVSDAELGTPLDQVRDAPVPDTVLPGLPIAMTGCFAGPGGLGKTQIMTQASIDIACGRNGLKKGGVLYIVGEDNREFHKLRQSDIMAHLAPAITDGEKSDIGKNLRTWYLTGKRVNLGGGGEDCFAFRRNLKLIEKDFRTNGVQLRLIVLDTLSNFNDGQENLSEQVAPLLAVLRQICHETGSSLVFLHHTTKSSVARGEDDAESVRGHSSLAYNIKWLTVMSPMTDKEAKTFGIPAAEQSSYVKTRLAKCNYLPPQPPQWWKRGENGIFTRVELKAEEADPADKTPKSRPAEQPKVESKPAEQPEKAPKSTPAKKAGPTKGRFYRVDA